MNVQQYGFILDVLFSVSALWIALQYLRVWWAYVIAGEMVFSLGVAILFGVFGVQERGLDATLWFFLYSIGQATAVLMLLFCLTKRYFITTYALAGLVALGLGLTVEYSGGYMGLGYLFLVVGFNGTKIALMVHYWRTMPFIRRHARFDRLHVWQN